MQGTDISPAMLNIAAEREVEGDICLHDLGHGLPLRPGTFDGAISISAVQWLCNAVRAGCQRAGASGAGSLSLHTPAPQRSAPYVRRPCLLPCPQDTTRNDPRKRLKRFFTSLYACLSKGARAVLQIYPENTEQASMLTNAAMRVGFTGGLVVDFPHSTRAKKYFLVLMVGGSAAVPAARGLDGEEGSDDEEVAVAQRRNHKRQKTGRKVSGQAGEQWRARPCIHTPLLLQRALEKTRS